MTCFQSFFELSTRQAFNTMLKKEFFPFNIYGTPEECKDKH